MTGTRLAGFALGIGLLTASAPFGGAQQVPAQTGDLSGYRPVAEATVSKAAPAAGRREGHTAYLGASVGRGSDGRLVVEEVQPESPAATAGLKKGDMIDKIGGHAVKTPQAFREWLLVHSPGDAVAIGVVRDGKPSDLSAKLVAASRPMQAGRPARPQVGVTLTEKMGKGIVVESVAANSPAALAGLTVGDVVISLDGQEMSRTSRLAEIVAEKRAGDTLTFGVTREGGKPQELKATLAADAGRSAAPGPIVLTGPALRLAVVCVEFAETTHNAKITPGELDRTFFSQATYTGKDATGREVRGSLADYFREQSGAALRLEGRVFDWVAVAKKRGDYIQGSGTSNKTAVLVDALEKLIARDGEKALDGFDALAFVYAGDRYRTNRGAVYYPHTGVVTVKSKRYHYVIGPEGGPTLTSIGTFVKPFGELLGLPDLAARPENIGSEGLGAWCAMSNTFETARPQHLSAWCKEKLGWVKPTVIDPSVRQKLILAPIEETRECLKLLVRPDGSEYILLENRRKTGFDSDLPGEGLLIWRVADGRPVLKESHGVEGPAGPTSHLTSVPYPSTANAAFTPDTTPSSRSPHGGGLPVHITNIRRLPDGRIAFQIGYEFR
ncbi:PDZ domain-containing protein [Fimbriiglobus ruber]|uniref:HtrA protease/chaperone protein n=1 Tax=Fimbriiglobus ruber TaxID=1908690 RepID=A0A225D7B6_9BACT|nr:PDZ domain-containing protein [Fimbriiglobus ruber]OWK37461.1 HtrA protease/chaperone protein [Fimbriiglobus ruber]